MIYEKGKEFKYFRKSRKKKAPRTNVLEWHFKKMNIGDVSVLYAAEIAGTESGRGRSWRNVSDAIIWMQGKQFGQDTCDIQKVL